MHEMALAQSIVATAEAEAAAGAFDRVEKIFLEIGALSCVDPHALAFGFDAAARGTLAEGAKLEFATPPGTARCFACERDVEVAERGGACPHCGSSRLVVTGGEEMKIKAMEVR